MNLTPTRPRTRGVHRAPVLLAALGVAAALGLSACGSDREEAASEQAAAVTIEDPWVKAVDEGMTATFGTLTNASDEDLTIEAAASDASPRVELHEMATDESGDMVMQEKEGGIVVPAGGEYELGPGGDHIMFVELPEAIVPGQDVTVTLTFSDDSTMSFTAPARSFAGAQEDYDPDAEGEGSEGGSHEDHDHGDEHDHGDHDH